VRQLMAQHSATSEPFAFRQWASVPPSSTGPAARRQESSPTSSSDRLSPVPAPASPPRSIRSSVSARFPPRTASSSSPPPHSTLALPQAPPLSPRSRARTALPASHASLAHDAAAALSALDTADADLRAARRICARNEDRARDLLRRSLHDAAAAGRKARSASDAAETGVASASSKGKVSIDNISAIVEPLRKTGVRREMLVTADGIVSLLAGDDNIPIDRAAALIAEAINRVSPRSEAKVSTPLTSPEALFDGDDEVLRKARTTLHQCFLDIQTTLTHAVVSAARSASIASELDPRLLHTCLIAAHALGGKPVHDLVLHAAIEALVANTSSIAVRGEDETSVSLQWRPSSPGAPPSPPASTYSLSSNRGGGDEFDVSRVLEPLQVARDDAYRVLHDFVANSTPTHSSLTFPYPLAFCLNLAKHLFISLVSSTAKSLLSSLERDVDQAAADLAAAVHDAQHQHRSNINASESGASSASSSTNAQLRNMCRIASERASRARRTYLNALASVSSILGMTECQLGADCIAFGVPPDEAMQVLAQARSSLDARLSQYDTLETRWLTEQVRAAFTDVGRVESQAPVTSLPGPTISNSYDAYHRYRVLYLHVAARLPQMTRRAVMCCHESLRRCVLMYASTSIDGQGPSQTFKGGPPPSSYVFPTSAGAASQARVASTDKKPDISVKESKPAPVSTSISVQTAKKTTGGDEKTEVVARRYELASDVMGELCGMVLSEFLSSAKTLLDGAKHLLPIDDHAARRPDIWSSGSSPFLSYCKAVRYLFDSNRQVDRFLQSFEVIAASGMPGGAVGAGRAADDAAMHMSAAGGLDDLIGDVFDANSRASLRATLRSGLNPLSREAKVGIAAAASGVAARLAAIIVDGADVTDVLYSASDAVLADRLRGSLLDESGVGGGAVDWAREDHDTSWYGAVDEEPSMPFVNASAFLEQQLGAAKVTLAGQNLNLAISVLAQQACARVLQGWRELNHVVSAAGGMQMSADARAILHVFGPSAPGSGVDSLPSVGRLFFTPAAELSTIVDAQPFCDIDPACLVDLIRKRPDAERNDHVKALCVSLASFPALT
jgi:hypothetical protein